MSQVEPTHEGLTADEYWRRQAEFPSTELIDGEVVEVSPATPPHGRIEGRMFRFLDQWADVTMAWVTCGEAGYRLRGRQVRGADVALHLQQPELNEQGFWTLPPDLVAEVVSPNDVWGEVEAKASEWLSFGVREVWLAEPRRRFVVVRRPEPGLAVFHHDATLVTPLLPGFSLEIAQIFR